MRANIGVGVGPVRVSQPLRMPGTGVAGFVIFVMVASFVIDHWRGLLTLLLIVWAAEIAWVVVAAIVRWEKRERARIEAMPQREVSA